ncbi:ABC transporter ATP-binding protein [Thiocystis violascens]|uniref:ABC-type antimicrobial peptide transport system, ATPase component n=1 Tax=Thiocystis violascens (strain ATCC 17096 / DSM 198 / 6111) TaxID=765911 RepID=I3Y9M0_THIV6|nr:ABC transporter ATP-binding protein [Thiocystis violascens]AFL73688.1 ABC-type antimicrobial peptide transport system, ATPase component [Thiocystis violascens DSM 198]
MLTIENLTKRFDATFDRPLFEQVSLTLAAGESVAIMGESGVGKSTLLNCIAGLESVDGGRIRLCETDLTTLDEDSFARLRRRDFGFVFQAFHLLPHLTLAQNVALPLWLLDRDERTADARARVMLERVGLGPRADDWPRHLSGGEMQRVAIARALVHEPALVLCDEPTGNLDPGRAAGVLALLFERIQAAGAVAILVTHSVVAAGHADRILHLTQGGLIAVPVGA